MSFEEIFGGGITRTQALVKAEHEEQGVHIGIRRKVTVGDDGASTITASTPTITLKQRGQEITVALAPDVAADLADALDQAADTARRETP